MARVKIKVERGNGLQQVIEVDTKATEGATIGTNVRNADGTLYVPGSGGGGLNIRNGYGISISGGNPRTVSVNRSANFAWQGAHEFQNTVDVNIASGAQWSADASRIRQLVPLQVSNPVRGGASGFEFTANVSETPTDGVEVQMAMWEDDLRLYGFRFKLDGILPDSGDLILYQHDNTAGGAEVFRISRSERQIQGHDGSTTFPFYGFSSERTLGIYRAAAGRLGISASAARVVGSAAGAGVGYEAQNLHPTGFSSFTALNDSGTAQVTFGHSNNSNRPYLNVTAGSNMTFQRAGTICWEFVSAGHWLGRDNIELQLGTGGDLRLFHNGTNSTIRNDTGNLSVLSGATEVLRFIQGADSRVHGLDGTAALPTFGWFGDPDNGLYYITTNSFGISTAGTLRYQFGAAGQFGIGGATYGTADTQAIVSGGASAAPSWQTVLVDGQTQTLGGAKTWSGDARFNAQVGFNNTAPIAQPTVSGSRADPEQGLANLLTALANYGLISNTTTA